MKKITALTLAFLFLSTKSNSQITNRNWLVGGTANFSTTTYKSDYGQHNTAYNIQVTPSIGYFIIDKFAAGLKVGFGKLGVKATGTSVYSNFTEYSFGPFLRYYIMPIEKQINILIDGGYHYGIEDWGSQKEHSHTFFLNIGPVIYFNTSVGIEFLIGYSASKYFGYAGNNGTVQVGIGLQVHLEK